MIVIPVVFVAIQERGNTIRMSGTLAYWLQGHFGRCFSTGRRQLPQTLLYKRRFVLQCLHAAQFLRQGNLFFVASDLHR